MPTSRPRPLRAAVAAISFGFIVAGTNSINPLLPFLRESVPLSPLSVSLTFVAYVVAAVAALMILTKVRRSASPSLLLVLGLVVASGANALLALPFEPTVLWGRFATGIAVGLATGSAAAIVVDSLRGRGRGLAATGNLLGAVIGASIAQIISTHASARMISATYITGSVTALILAATLVMVTFVRPSSTGASEKSLISTRVNFARQQRKVLAGAAVAWTALSVAVVYAPLLFHDQEMRAAQLGASVVMLLAAASAQLLAGVLERYVPRFNGYIVMLVGLLLAGVSVFLHSDGLGITALGLLGAGAAHAYRAALVLLTRDADAPEQMIRTSKFAVVTYSASAAGVLLIGFANQLLPLLTVLSITALMFCTLALWAAFVRTK